MNWPNAIRYSAAIQAPAACFSDPDLSRGRPEVDQFLGLPLTYAGGFANVYKILCPANEKGDSAWAVKCFTRDAPDRQKRYQLISRHLELHRKKFVVPFQYIEEGIKVDGTWYPIVKMQWVEGGFTLNEFLRDHAGSASLLEQLGELWLRLSVEMRDAAMAHGDLQHGNVLLVPGKNANSLHLRLIDYDGMWVPDLAKVPPNEVGHPNYQHPQRLREGGYGGAIDRFAHLAMYTALRALQTHGMELWNKHDNGENLLFREADFREPANSRLFPDLLVSTDTNVRTLAGHLLCACLGPLDRTPNTNALIEDGKVVPLQPVQRDRVLELVPSVRKTWEKDNPAVVRPPARPSKLQGPVVLDVAPVPPPLPVSPPTHPTPKPNSGSPLNRLPIRLRPVALGVILAVPLVAIALLVLLPGKSAPPVEPQSPDPLSRLTFVPAVRTRVAQSATVDVQVDRMGNLGTLRLAVSNLPHGATCAATVLPMGDGLVVGRLEFVISDLISAMEVPIVVALQDGAGNEIERRTTTLTITPFFRPLLEEVTPRPIELVVGGSTTVSAKVVANNNTDPWRLRIKGLPAGVVEKPAPAIPPANVALVLEADEKTTVSSQLVSVELLAGETVAGSATLALAIVKPMPRVTLTLPPVLALQAGGSVTLPVQLTRTHVFDAVQLVPVGNPNKVTIATVTVPAGVDRAALEVQSAPDIAGQLERRETLKVEARLGNQVLAHASTDLILPRAVAMVPMPPVQPKARPEVDVVIPTADGLSLNGTFYPTANPTRSPTVLMVHDLNQTSNRKSPGWVRLAKGLCGQGCQVLTLDLRGYGDPDEAVRPIPAAFWNVTPNKSLSKWLPGKTKAPKLENRFFPIDYMPWLVQDLIAARAWLDLKHDAQEANTQHLIVVGAGEGAYLSAQWLATEARRCTTAQLKLPATKREYMAREVAGAVWLGANESGRLFSFINPHQAQLTKRLQERQWPTMMMLSHNNFLLPSAQRLGVAFKQPNDCVKMVDAGGAVGVEMADYATVVKETLTYVQRLTGEQKVPAWEARDLRRTAYYWDVGKSGNLAWGLHTTTPRLFPLATWGYTQLKNP